MRKLLLLLAFLPVSMFAQFSSTAYHIAFGTTLPLTCNPLSGDIAFITTGVSLGPYYCSAVDTWAPMGSAVGTGTVTSITIAGTANKISVSGTCTVTTSGTCTLTIPSSVVLVTPVLGVATATSINGLTITSSTGTLTIANGVVLTGPSSSATVATIGLTNTFTGRQAAGGAASTQPLKTGTSLPGTCIAGDLYFKTDATAGQNIYECASTDTWTQQLNSGVGGSPGGSTTQLQYNNAGSFGGTADFTFASNTITSGASGILDMSAGKVLLPSSFAGSCLGLTSVGGSNVLAVNATCSGYAGTSLNNTFTGANTFSSGGTAGSLGLSAQSPPSAIASGFWNYDTNGWMGWFNNTQMVYPITILGSAGRTAPTAPSAGVLHVAGSTFAATSSSVVNGDIGANAVSSSKMAVVNTRRVCDIGIGDTSGSVITNGQLGPQKRGCFIPYAATVVEVDVSADAGTPNVIVGRNIAGTQANLLSGALATASSGAIACSNTGGTTGLDGVTTCTNTLQNTAIAAGGYLELVSGTAGGVAKWMTVHIVYTVD